MASSSVARGIGPVRRSELVAPDNDASVTLDPATTPDVVFPAEFRPLSDSVHPRDLFCQPKAEYSITYKFPSSTELNCPTDLFYGSKPEHSVPFRFTMPDDPGKCAVFAAGACIWSPGNPRAGWAFCYGADGLRNPLSYEGPVRAKGPAMSQAQLNSRAELHAVVAALKFRKWSAEGFHTLVIVTDSFYVVNGATAQIKTWLQTGWKSPHRPGQTVLDQDLWETLLEEIKCLKGEGMAVEFWRIALHWNMASDAAVKAALSRNDTT